MSNTREITVREQNVLAVINRVREARKERAITEAAHAKAVNRCASAERELDAELNGFGTDHPIRAAAKVKP